MHQNKENAEGVKKAIWGEGEHTFGEHVECGDWCRAKKDPTTTRDYSIYNLVASMVRRTL